MSNQFPVLLRARAEDVPIHIKGVGPCDIRGVVPQIFGAAVIVNKAAIQIQRRGYLLALRIFPGDTEFEPHFGRPRHVALAEHRSHILIEPGHRIIIGVDNSS